MTKDIKVALVCDWLTGYGGAERVIYELHQLYPDAPIYTSQYDSSRVDWLDDADVRTTWLQRLPKSLKKFLPVLRAITFRRLDLSEYDVVISSSGAEAKGVTTGPSTIHINYCHSPTHYYWIRHEEYLARPGFPRGFNWLARLSLKLLVGPLKRWDYLAAQRPDFIIANSTATQAAVKRYYRRDAEVIHPPVDTERFKVTGKPPLRHGLLIAGRQTPYKRVDLAVEACNELKIPLVVIGDGPDHRRLEKLAGRNVTFLSRVGDHEMAAHFQSALAFIMPNRDDFGVVAVEALSAGTPVVAYRRGGALDYIKDGRNGVFFDKQTAKSLGGALQTALGKTFSHESIAEGAQAFSIAAFRRHMKDYVDKCLHEAKEG